MEKYIQELLQDHDRVIIPNFGGFLKSKGEVNALIFNEFIKFNDGQLINYVAKEEDISIDEASALVDQYAEKLKSRLQDGKEVQIEGVGYLYRSDTGRIHFKSGAAEGAAVPKDPEKKEAKAEEARVDKIREQKPEREKKEKTESTPEKKLPETQKQTEKLAAKQKEPAKKPVPVEEEKRKTPAPVPEKEAALPVSEKSSAQSGRIPQQDPRTPPPPADKSTKEDKKKRNPLLWILPLAIILAIIAWVAMDYDNIRGYFYMDSEEVAQTEASEVADVPAQEGAEINENAAITASEDEENMQEAGETAEIREMQTPAEDISRSESFQEEAAVVETPEEIVEDETEQQQQIPSAPPKEYHLIAGVFSERENADDLVGKLKNEGFYAEIIGFINNKYYVSYNSFKNKTDARYEWERLRDKGYDAWLYYY